jgi:hypothetical protein
MFNNLSFNHHILTSADAQAAKLLPCVWKGQSGSFPPPMLFSTRTRSSPSSRLQSTLSPNVSFHGCRRESLLAAFATSSIQLNCGDDAEEEVPGGEDALFCGFFAASGCFIGELLLSTVSILLQHRGAECCGLLLHLIFRFPAGLLRKCDLSR